MTLLQTTLDAIRPVDAEVLAEATRRQDDLTKPPGSLGRLETVAIRLCGIAGTVPPPVPERAAIGVFAGDHGICAQGVTPWPQDVTVQMLMNMASGGAAINVLSRTFGADLLITDVGVAGDYPTDAANIRRRNVRRGTADFSQGPAMTRDEAVAAIEVGIATAEEALDGGAQALLTGEMGIGNTSPSTALIAALTGTPVAEITGRGAGADDAMLDRKTAVLRAALEGRTLDPADPVGVLAEVGGLEIAAMAGFILGGVAHRVPVILDGVIACSAACVAVSLDDRVRDHLVAGHAGVEPAILVALEWLGLEALVDLDLRLGEGSGAALALPLVRAAARLYEMASFSDIGIDRG
ncbi:nicotinate-nucleotide--dimethylbenzimidazole phosphoribosyltransferase [uncultured Tessaracoccus sp.]|mgnify:FL=1|uniref:nicotinate-nucleotide--dimethylbenzimidazole phosphoribosyltransferase n=1 Tax=uncultured Tessaracoccus sp. TaxID=905023 RepID=UPI0025D8119B|nr:nicotinate-nucleotide--dimethylbenzimidazole phosphoribosyltransferase [uncultured Tessaracoccus sp.]